MTLPAPEATDDDLAVRRRAAAEGLCKAGLTRRAETMTAGARRREYMLTGVGIVVLRRRGGRLGPWARSPRG